MNPALEFWGTAFDRENILARMLTSEIIKSPSPILMGSRPEFWTENLKKICDERQATGGMEIGSKKATSYLKNFVATTRANEYGINGTVQWDDV